MGRYRTVPDDITTLFRKLSRRVDDLETVRRLGFSSVEGGLIVLATDVPEIILAPDVAELQTTRLSIYAGYYDDPILGQGIDASMIVNSFDGSDWVANGGKVTLDSIQAIFSHQPLLQGDNESFIWLNAAGNPSEIIRIQGRFYNNAQADNLQAILPASFTTGSGFSSFTFTYFTPFSGAAWPICTLLNTSGGAVAWCLTAASTSSFTIAWATGTTDKRIMLWTVRMDS